MNLTNMNKEIFLWEYIHVMKTIKLIVSIITYDCLIKQVIFSSLIKNRHTQKHPESGKQMETLRESQLGNER